MGNASSVQEVDYSRKKGKVIEEKKVAAIPKEKHLRPEQLAVVFPYLEAQAETLSKRVEHLNATRGWESEYGGITDGEESPATFSENPDNAVLNRYRNIVAYDHSRVRVSPSQHNGRNDYVNANWIPGHRQNRGYIASQGPVPDSMVAFWQMVWQSGTTCIVMVTNEIEGNKLKCHRYWPSREAPIETYGAVEVGLLEETVKSTFIHRLFEIKCDGGKFCLDHFQYTVWPDHGVPNTTAELISFRKEVRRVHPHPAPPILVHCSAGVGRTGTFITVDTIMNRAEHMESDLDIHSCVCELRASRNYMVQTIVQYQFAFKTILDGLDKAIARTVRAVQNKSDEIAAVAANIEELELEIGEAMDEYGGAEFGDDLEALGEQMGTNVKRVQADVRWSAFNPEADRAPAARVPSSVRKQALDAAPDMWRARNNVAFTAGEKGYENEHRVGLVGRVEALSVSASPEAWRSRYAEMAGSWVSDVYDVSAALDPLESRMMSLAQQQNNWKLRGKGYRQQIEQDTKVIVADLNARLQSLGSVLRTSEDRWRSKGDGFRGEVTADGPVGGANTDGSAPQEGALMGRLQSLVAETKPDAWKARGVTDGREVESPDKERRREEAAKKASEAARLQQMREQEAVRLAQEKAERQKREEEARVKADRQNPTARGNTVAEERPVKQMFKLKSPKKSAASHPMFETADEDVVSKLKGRDSKKKKKK
eukprot:m.273273 g.273273  ORF g.273273 m.273273 type:complete len:710 (-) comp26882_c1_seq1:256-2385(-)